MVLKYKFRGAMAPVFTPFSENYGVKLNMIEGYSVYLKQLNVRGVLVGGTTGEGVSMTLAERKDLTDAWITAGHKVDQSVMIQVGGGPLVEVISLAKHAEDHKADAILCLPELFFKPKTVEDLINYLFFVSKGAPNTPLLYYHIPSFTGVNLDMAEFLIKCRERIPTLAGIKFTHTDMEEGARCIAAAQDDLVVFLGADQIISAASVLGFDSLIATTINLWPNVHEEILCFARHDKLRECKTLQGDLTRRIQLIIKHGSWVSSMKAAMSVVSGLDMGPVRPPLMTLNDSQMLEIARDLKNACITCCGVCVSKETKNNNQ